MSTSSPIHVRTAALNAEIASLKAALSTAEHELASLHAPHAAPTPSPGLPMPLADYTRYGRQMILDDFGLPVHRLGLRVHEGSEAQLRLRQANILVVGAGGLGCPALLYLASSGVGTLGIVDPDTVELSNLHRQVLHTEARIGWPKALSARDALLSLNSTTTIHTYITSLTSSNALSIVAAYDLVLDCTDNLPTRYLLSDACVELGKPLISGAAIRYDGQMAVYNLPLSGAVPLAAGLAPAEDSPVVERGPCYRCLFPTPPMRSPLIPTTCAEVGVLPPVTGLIGTLQACEAVKLLTSFHLPDCGSDKPVEQRQPMMVMYDARSEKGWRSVKLRGRREGCNACGTGMGEGLVGRMDYVAFCGGPQLDPETTGARSGIERISVSDLRTKLRTDPNITIIDVRPPAEFSICHLPSSINIPMQTFNRSPLSYLLSLSSGDSSIYVLCKLGNDSQLVAAELRKTIGSIEGKNEGLVMDVMGGLRAWSRQVDPGFPTY